jgi:hypothetical protein
MRVNVGPVSMEAGLNLDEFLRRVNNAITEISRELESKGSVKVMGFTMVQ